MSDVAGLVAVPRDALDLNQAFSRFSTPDRELEARLREQLQHTYQYSVEKNLDVANDLVLEDVDSRVEERAAGERDEEYEFRLFSRPIEGQTASSRQTPRRIAIRSPTPVSGDPGFLIPRRPESHYFTGPLDGVRAKQIVVAAVSGEDVLNGLNLRWRGCELPWRVTIINSNQSKVNLRPGDPHTQSTSNKKKRTGKKRRIAIRKKLQAVKAKQDLAKQSQGAKEAAQKEKRTSMNRKKKVKRKQKEKLEKLEKLKAEQNQDLG